MGRPTLAQKYLYYGKPEGECVIWPYARNAKGYGIVYAGGKNTYLHRLTWYFAHGETYLHVLHKCDNPPCYKVEHLFVGTNKDNVLDREAKGRGNHPTGESHGRSVLSNKEVALLRECYKLGDSRANLAYRFGISWTQVDRIIKGEQRR